MDNHHTDQSFVDLLYQRMLAVNAAIAEMEVFEFGYGLETLEPEDGWSSVAPEPCVDIERRIKDSAFFYSIALRPMANGKPVMDAQVRALTQTLMVGLATGFYTPEWVRQYFTFDVRGFYFFVRTHYYTDEIISRLGGAPYRQFEPKQKLFEARHAISYREFMEANAEIDRCFMDLVMTLVDILGRPVIIAIAGQTGAGKTEITARLTEYFVSAGQRVTTVEIDHFLLDRDYREARGIDSLGMKALHGDLFKSCLQEVLLGRRVITPSYDFISAMSSHDEMGRRRPGSQEQVIEPAEIIFMEGNFPFIDAEVAKLIGIKAMYLTDDDIRLKRKWRRDMDYRKKYERTYFLNRYFREQFIMLEQVYRPQMAHCDLLVDTTAAALWAIPALQNQLNGRF